MKENNMKMKKGLLFPALICAAMLTACSQSGESAAMSGNYKGSMTNGAAYDSGGSASYESYDDYGGDYIMADAASDTSYENASEGGLTADTLRKEMLVYSCTMSIDTLDFGASIDTFRSTLDLYGGFIEQENYSDGGHQGSWYSGNDQKWQTYTATLRVPSRNYDDFCNAAAQLGDLRSKNASVQNVSQEYSDLETTLKIYEAKEERYIALLAGITDDEYAITIEKELTELQIQIAKIRTRMNEIQTDVAYSYVYITIKEVREYTSEPVKTDTFLDRLMVTLKDAGSGFLSFLEGLLFLLIYTVPYVVLIGIIVFIIVSIIKAIKRHKKAKREKLSSLSAEQPSAVSEESDEGEKNPNE